VGTSKEELQKRESLPSTNINCYCGTYDVREDRVVHHVEAASFPNSVGKDLVRTFTLSGDELRVVTSPTLVGGKLETVTLVFQRST
jgi:hypothetical protein